ncbi:MAG: hypothetical protein RLZZ568_789 [Cyanobacteriota bacterium]|jgi:hypothetical protein
MKRHKKAVIPSAARQNAPPQGTSTAPHFFRHRDRGIHQGRVESR